MHSLELAVIDETHILLENVVECLRETSESKCNVCVCVLCSVHCMKMSLEISVMMNYYRAESTIN